MAGQAHPMSSLTSAAEIDLSRSKVLILDPFVATRRLLTDMLIRGLRVGSADSCSYLSEAVRKLDLGSFNLLITDWSNETDALALLGQLRHAESLHRYLPVVVMTAYNRPEDVKAARDAGASEFMLKPFSLAMVQSRLRAIAQAPRPFVASTSYFGPDRRRRRDFYDGTDRRGETKIADRRHLALPWPLASERRQSRTVPTRH